MKTFRYCFSVLMLLALAVCCTRLDDPLPMSMEFKAGYAESCPTGMDSYRLTLVQGRVDDNMELISSGAKLELLLTAPVTGDGSIPVGTYSGHSDASPASFTFYCDPLAAADAETGSYVDVVPSGRKGRQRYPLEMGEVRISAQPGAYEVKAVVAGGAHTFTFRYAGEIPVYD